ncbi:MAG: hypothetical protein ABR961_06040 [Thermoanaerobaculaceae bacterium]
MSERLSVSCCLAMVLIALQAAAAPPELSKPAGAPPPPIAVTPTPMISAAHPPFTLPACTASGTVTFDAADHAKNPSVDRYRGSWTLTANRDLWAVTIYTMIYQDGPHGAGFLRGCDCPECPNQGGNNPATAPPNSNFKRLETRTYQILCSWPNGGYTISPPFRSEIDINYFTKTDRAQWQKGGAACGNLTFVK